MDKFKVFLKDLRGNKMELRPYLYASTSSRAKAAQMELERRYGNFKPQEANVLIALGGDGLMLEALTEGLKHQLPVYGMNRGHVGARLNNYEPDKLEEKISNAVAVDVNPLCAVGTYLNGQARVHFNAVAWNEVSVMRLGSQAAHLLIKVGKEKEFLSIGDGHIIATPLGSTSYNESAGGHLLGWRESLLASTSICSISAAIHSYLNDWEKVHITPLHAVKRPVQIAADNLSYENVMECGIFKDFSRHVQVLYDPSQVERLDRRARIIRFKRPFVRLLNKMQERLRQL